MKGGVLDAMSGSSTSVFSVNTTAAQERTSRGVAATNGGGDGIKNNRVIYDVY